MTKKTRVQNRAKRGTYITPRAAVTPSRPRDYWPATVYSPIRRYVAKRYTPPSSLINHALRARLERIPRRLRPMIPLIGKPRKISGMHDTPFKRPQISSYGAWQKGLAFTLPESVRLCVQRSARREAVFASTGGGSIRRKSTNRRTPRSEIRCK